jgi:hypothetical protein
MSGQLIFFWAKQSGRPHEAGDDEFFEKSS